MQTSPRLSPLETGASSATLPDRERLAQHLERLEEQDLTLLAQNMADDKQDETLISGLELYLDRAAHSRFLHTVRLEQAGYWLGNNAPARLQIRLLEVSKSSQHPAFAAFRAGFLRSGGLTRAFPEMR